MRRAYMAFIIVIIIFIISIFIGIFTYFQSLNIGPKQERKVVPLELKIIDPETLAGSNETTN